MNKRILIDGSNFWYRAHCMASSRQLDNPGAAVTIMTYMLRRVCSEFGKRNVIICWDAGRGGRTELDPDYKAKRKSVPEVWTDLPYMKKMVACLGLREAQHQGYEADDVIGSLSRDEDSTIVSYDKDFYQLVADNVEILRPERTVRGNEIPREIIQENEVIEEFGCTPGRVILVKGFKGDASDNIPKLPIRFSQKFKKTFYSVITKSKTVDDFYSYLDEFDEKYHDQLKDFKDRAKLNVKLVTIIRDLDVNIDTHKLSAQAFEKLCKELEINRLKIADWESMPDEAAPPPPVQNSLF